MSQSQHQENQNQKNASTEKPNIEFETTNNSDTGNNNDLNKLIKQDKKNKKNIDMSLDENVSSNNEGDYQLSIDRSIHHQNNT